MVLQENASWANSLCPITSDKAPFEITDDLQFLDANCPPLLELHLPEFPDENGKIENNQGYFHYTVWTSTTDAAATTLEQIK